MIGSRYRLKEETISLDSTVATSKMAASLRQAILNDPEMTKTLRIRVGILKRYAESLVGEPCANAF